MLKRHAINHLVTRNKRVDIIKNDCEINNKRDIVHCKQISKLNIMTSKSSYMINLPMSAMNYLKDENEKGRTKNGKNRLFVFMEIVQRTILSELAGSKPVVSYKDLLSVSQWSRATLTKFLANLLAEKVITINDNKSSEISLAPRILLKIDEHSSGES